MEKIIVTGSNGFIGTHVCKYMHEKGYEIVGLGRRSKPASLVDAYICCDIGTDVVLSDENLRKMDGASAMIHLAADMRGDPHTVEVVTANCGGTERLLQACRKCQIPVFVQLSSLPVIGEPIRHPITETHPLDPYTVYHVTKVMEEMLAAYASKAYGFRTASFRISAPIGIGVNPKTIFPTFVRQAVAGENLTIFGKGTRQQTYIHARDIARALDMAIHSEASGCYNLSSTNRLSDLDLAKKCVELTSSASQIVFSGTENYMDGYIWDVSLEKLRRDTGFEPAVSIDEAIMEYAGYIRGLGKEN